MEMRLWRRHRRLIFSLTAKKQPRRLGASMSLSALRAALSWISLEVLSVISPWNPLSTRSFHKENSAIAEGLVLLRDRFLDSSELVVLCF